MLYRHFGIAGFPLTAGKRVEAAEKSEFCAAFHQQDFRIVGIGVRTKKNEGGRIFGLWDFLLRLSHLFAGSADVSSALSASARICLSVSTDVARALLAHAGEGARVPSITTT